MSNLKPVSFTERLVNVGVRWQSEREKFVVNSFGWCCIQPRGAFGVSFMISLSLREEEADTSAAQSGCVDAVELEVDVVLQHVVHDPAATVRP